MRYQKGSIGLNDRKDKALLTLVADSRYVTHSQLFGLADADFVESNRRVFNWRVRRLVKHGLVRKQVIPFLNDEALYAITRAGTQALEQLGVYYLGASLDREKDPSESRAGTKQYPACPSENQLVGEVDPGVVHSSAESLADSCIFQGLRWHRFGRPAGGTGGLRRRVRARA